ncbi:hypothetical protein D3C76_728750 [compost metagenome]
MRKEWYHAFYSLNIEQLDYLEADWFFSTNGMKLMHKSNQLHKLSALRSKDRCALASHKRVECNIQIRELGNLATVSGLATITSPDGVKNINFVENWIKIQDAWKLQFLTFEDDDL